MGKGGDGGTLQSSRANRLAGDLFQGHPALRTEGPHSPQQATKGGLTEQVNSPINKTNESKRV